MQAYTLCNSSLISTTHPPFSSHFLFLTTWLYCHLKSDYKTALRDSRRKMVSDVCVGARKAEHQRVQFLSLSRTISQAWISDCGQDIRSPFSLLASCKLSSAPTTDPNKRSLRVTSEVYCLSSTCAAFCKRIF